MVVDARGNAYVGSFPPASDPDGVARPRTPDGAAEIVAREVRFPNGCVIADGGRTLIVAESLGRRFARFTIAADGTLSDRTVFADVAPRGPDGICLDADGRGVGGDDVGARVRAGRARRRDPRHDRDRRSSRDRVRTRRPRPAHAVPPAPRSSTRPTRCVDTRDATIHVVEVDVPGAGSP